MNAQGRLAIACAVVAIAASTGAGQATATAEPYRNPTLDSELQALLRAEWPNDYSAAEQALGAADVAIMRGLWRARTAAGSLPDFLALGIFQWTPEQPYSVGLKIRRNFDEKWLRFSGNPWGTVSPNSAFTEFLWWSACPLGGHTPGCEIDLNGLAQPGWVMAFRGPHNASYELGSMRILDTTTAQPCYLWYGDWYCDAGRSPEEDERMRVLWSMQAQLDGERSPYGSGICDEFGRTRAPMPCFFRFMPHTTMEQRMKLDAFGDFESGLPHQQTYPRNCGSCTFQVPATLNLEAARSYLDGSGAEATAARGWINQHLQRRVPLLFLPGITGSTIERDGRQLWPNRDLVTDPFDSWLLDLRLAPDGVSEFDGGPAAIPRDILRRIDLNDLPDESVYDVTIDWLEDIAGYSETVDLFSIPFDWRKSAAVNGDRLLERIDQIRAVTGSAQVDILAHSQGGLVTLSALSKPESFGKVRRVLTLGSPVLGATKALGAVHFADPCFAREILGTGLCVLNKATVKAAISNMPGVFELLPTRAFHSAVGSPLVLDRDGTEAALTYDEWTDILKPVGNNTFMLSEAEAFHDALDAAPAPADPSVELRRIVGTGLGTLGSFRVYVHEECVLLFAQCLVKADHDLLQTDGDGTVPENSADLFNGPAGFDRRSGAPNIYTDVMHGDLPKDDCVLAYASHFFKWGDSLPVPECTLAGAGSVTALQAAATRIADEPFPLNGTQVQTVGPVAAEVSDASGNVLGQALQEISGGSYAESERTKSFFVTEPASYEARAVLEDNRPVHIVVRDYADGKIASQATFDVPAAVAGSVLTLAFTPSDDVHELRVAVDAGGDGSVDETVAPVVALGDLALDSTKPETIAGGTQISSSNSSIVLSAIDSAGGSGVAATYYLLEGGDAPQRYRGPFAAPLGSLLKFRSIDRAGNLEDVQEIVVDDVPNYRSLAAELSKGAQVKRHLDPAGDTDWFWFEAIRTSTYRAKLEGLHADYDLELYDADGRLIEASRHRGKKNEEIHRQLLAGTYYLRVDGFQDAADADHQYHLKLSSSS